MGMHSARKREKGTVAEAAGVRAPLALTPEPRREAMFMLDLILIFSFLADCKKKHLSVRSRLVIRHPTGENPDPKFPLDVTTMAADQSVPTLRLHPIAVPTKNQ